MPIKVQSDLPVRAILESENIFVMDETRAVTQDIRPLKIGILNLMPLKEDTEPVQHAAAAGHYLYHGQQPRVEKHGPEPYP